MIYFTAVRLSPPSANSHEHITELRWRNPASGDTGTSTKVTLVDWVNGGGTAKVEGNPDVNVYVVEANPPHLRTAANGKYTDNLLSLPRF